MDTSAFGIPEQLLENLENTDNLKWTLSQNKQGALLKLVWRNRPQQAHDDPRPRPITANHVDRGAHDGAKLHVAKRLMQLSKNKEHKNPLHAARTAARRRGNPNMGKES